MKYVPINHDRVTLVDDEDYESMSQHKWFTDPLGYVVRKVKGKKSFMHREILFGSNEPNGYEVDHKNRNKLDNRRSNLRKCDRFQNTQNRCKQSNNKSGYKGVYWHSSNKKWAVQISAYGVKYRLGMFDDINEAVKVRKAAEIVYHKEFRVDE